MNEPERKQEPSASIFQEFHSREELLKPYTGMCPDWLRETRKTRAITDEDREWLKKCNTRWD